VHNIIVIGASAGGVEALREIVRNFPPSFQAAIFIVLHIPSDARSILPELLDQAGPTTAAAARNGERILPSKIYVAPPDYHLLVHPGIVTVYRGPRENRHRPAVDPLFRSAAKSYGKRVVGVVLTGQLDDGAVGIQIIKAHDGVVVVQDPADAQYSGMPMSALRTVKADHVLPLREIGPLLVRLAGNQWQDVQPDPNEVNRAMKNDVAPNEDERVLGTPSTFACPECHGTLWEMSEPGSLHFRCRVGHAYAAESVEKAHSESVEAALWVALRALEENVAMERRLAERMRQTGQTAVAGRYDDIARSRQQHADLLRRMLLE
jgi:two-component system, chemotaxis family, protein-glutamate methylesterase/glutaminase